MERGEQYGKGRAEGSWAGREEDGTRLGGDGREETRLEGKGRKNRKGGQGAMGTGREGISALSHRISNEVGR